jgi:4-diphosphocytidyl-2-C-methyl-D-erythritol kinase
MTAVRVLAPAKLTVSLRVHGTRADGLHELDAEMVSVDLCDELEIEEGPDGLEVVGDGVAAVAAGPDNLVRRALAAVGRTARVRLTKRIPAGGGLGGGSSDAAAVLRWAGCTDVAVAAGLGADVPFCVRGGRARVGGAGERVTPLDPVARSFVLLVPPLAVDTAAVYRAWDALAEPDRHSTAPDGNDLTAAALMVEPRLAAWRDALGELTGSTPALAGSGATWFVEGRPEPLGVGAVRRIEVGGAVGTVMPVETLGPQEAAERPRF